MNMYDEIFITRGLLLVFGAVIFLLLWKPTKSAEPQLVDYRSERRPQTDQAYVVLATVIGQPWVKVCAVTQHPGSASTLLSQTIQEHRESMPADKFNAMNFNLVIIPLVFPRT